MKLFYIGIISYDTREGIDPKNKEPSQELAVVKDVSSPSLSYAQFMTFFAKQLAEKSKPNQRQDVAQDAQDFVFHIYAHKLGVCGVAISDAQYPSLAAHKLLGNVVSEFLEKFPASSWKDLAASSPRANIKDQLAQYQSELQQKLAQYQDPAQIDTIGQIQRELDDTKQVLHQTIESVLGRQEKLDELVHKSNDLSDMSKGFYKKGPSAFLVAHGQG
ncbi:SNARE Ykt6 [Metarhizium acridum CQMa 102]|uniref:SNARE Ykt6 n=1 Tax=Metarhizium acridum (strain CQMa 102) TaxID=655827 RepID=E9E948_METAQ|nr:SNARE Ykt6 [Metarhizium acridum CQMa 102]EFY87552.1 SNARE Ykt6 [Metarhizium acridum CQMa 102]